MFRYGPESLGGNGYLKEKIDRIIADNDDESVQNKEIVKVSIIVCPESFRCSLLRHDG